jgi:hypothetical protein
MESAKRGRAFDRLRKTYPTRREFRHTVVTISGEAPDLADTLGALHFRVASQA